MVAVLDSMMFAAAFAASVWVFAFTLMPAMPRIVALLRGEADIAVAPNTFVTVSERRLRTRPRPVRQVRPAAIREAA